MTQVRVLRRGHSDRKQHRRKKMTIKPLGADWKITVPYAPRQVSHTNLAPEWEEVRRTSRDPLVLRSNDPTPRMAFTLLFGDEENHRVDGDLRRLMRVARNEKPVRVAYSTWETGNWRISSFSFDSVLRHPISNEITRAEVSIEFVNAEDIRKHMGPLSGGVKKADGGKKGGKRHDNKTGRPPKKGSGKPRRYKVKRGDTLSEIAVKFYRDASMWRKIADVNNIRNPRKLRIGKVLRLP